MSADRRTFLAGLAATALPVAIITDSAAAGEASARASFDDYASAEFDGIAQETDLAELRQTFESQWPILAMALMIVTKDESQVASAMAAMDRPSEQGETASRLMAHVKDVEDWFRDTADVLAVAHVRMLCGMARTAKERVS